MTANVEAMVREGIRATRAGKKAEARALLEKAIELDQYHEDAWLWLSAVVDSADDRRTCLENVLVINPNNQSAKQGLAMLTGQPDTPAQPASPPPPSQPVFSEPFDDIPTSGGFGPPPTETSSASSVFTARPEPTAEDYDQWMAGLKLGNSSVADTVDEPKPTASPTSFSKDMLDGFFDDEDEEVDEQPVAPPRSAPPPSNARDALLDAFEMDSDFGDGPFSADALDLDIDIPAPPKREPQRSPSRSSRAPAMSPGPENVKASSPGPTFEDDGFTDLSGGLFVDPEADDYGSIDYGSGVSNTSDFFQLIPHDIKATRLPGTNESPSPIALLIVVGLVVLNLGAVVVLIGSFAG